TRFAGVKKALRFLRIREIRPRAINSHTVGYFSEGDFQPDGQTRFFGKRAVWFIDESAAAQCDHGFRRSGESFETETLDLAKTRLAVLFENVGDRATFPAFDFFIEVDEFPSQLLGKAPPDCRFAGAHESDEIDAVKCHSRSLYRQSE